MNWLEALRGSHVGQIAGALGGFTVVRRGRTTHIGPCPACGQRRRHRKSRDRRGAIGLRPDGKGWRCFQCDVGGDALDFVSYHLTDRRLRETSGDQRAAVRAWCLDYSPSMPVASTSTPEPEPEPDRCGFPPCDQIEGVWQACVRVTDDLTIVRWLDDKKLDAVSIADLDLARALPHDFRLPPWAVFGRRYWTELGNRLLVPLYDQNGDLRSLIARYAVKNASPQTPKSLPPKGYDRAGLVMADPLGRSFLSGSLLPTRFVVTEGERDFLGWACTWSDADEDAAAVFGVVSGAWSKALGKRIPAGSTLMIATDADEAGDKYAARIVSSLRSDVSITRWLPEDDLL